MWRKKEKGIYEYNDYYVIQIDGLGWCLLKGNEGIGRFKTLAQAKSYVKKQNV